MGKLSQKWYKLLVVKCFLYSWQPSIFFVSGWGQQENSKQTNTKHQLDNTFHFLVCRVRSGIIHQFWRAVFTLVTCSWFFSVGIRIYHVTQWWILLHQPRKWPCVTQCGNPNFRVSDSEKFKGKYILWGRQPTLLCRKRSSQIGKRNKNFCGHRAVGWPDCIGWDFFGQVYERLLLPSNTRIKKFFPSAMVIDATVKLYACKDLCSRSMSQHHFLFYDIKDIPWKKEHFFLHFL